MSQGRNGQGYAGRVSAWGLLGAAALLVGTVMMGSAALAADEPPTTLGADAPTTTVAAPDPPVQTGDPVAPPAADPSVGAAAITEFKKAFADTAIAPGGVTKLTFTITVTSDSTGLTFTDPLDNFGMAVAASPASSTDCEGTGAFSPAAGDGTITFSNWDLSQAKGTCTAVVNVTSSTPGDHVNTSSTLASTAPGGTVAAATATLHVDAPPGFSKAFSPSQITPTGISTLTYTIDNAANALDATALAFKETLPSNVTIAANPPTASSTDCTGGTLKADAGTAAIDYSGGSATAGKSCTVSVNVTSSVLGTYPTTSGALTSSDGDSGTASATLVVAATTVSTLPITPAAASLALTGGPKTGLLAGIGFGTLLFGALLVLATSQRRRLARR